jgi:hypothetical protein
MTFMTSGFPLPEGRNAAACHREARQLAATEAVIVHSPPRPSRTTKQSARAPPDSSTSRSVMGMGRPGRSSATVPRLTVCAIRDHACLPAAPLL